MTHCISYSETEYTEKIRKFSRPRLTEFLYKLNYSVIIK